MDISDNHFPESDIVAEIYSGEINFDEEDFGKMESIVVGFESLYMEGDYLEGELRKSTKTFIFSKEFFFASDIFFWWTDFKTFLAEKKGTSDWRQAVSNDSIAQFLSDFLFHPDGGKNMDRFMFETELVCGEPASKIKVHNFARPLSFNNTNEQLSKI